MLLKRHNFVHNLDKRHKCAKCYKSYNLAFDLDIHMSAVHSMEKPYKCSECENTFAYPSNLKRHLQNHNGKRSDICEQCKESFNQPSNLKTHIYRCKNKLKLSLSGNLYNSILEVELEDGELENNLEEGEIFL